MKTILVFSIILLIIQLTTVFTQNIVISEYYNVTGYPSGEWTELLIIEDNTNLVGYVLRDNQGSNNTPNSWQGGVRFLDNDLWKHLRAGTIIIIHHRGLTAIDEYKDDGYIEVSAENTTYFEKVCFACTMSDWIYRALSISQNADILQIIDENNNHIHSLSHMPGPAGDYLTLPYPKINHQNQLSGASSVCIVPGINLSAYGAGNDNNQTAITNNPTMGKPNNSLQSIDENQIFWRKLRQPEWFSPKLSALINKDSIRLNWNSSTDPYPDDSTHGYVIIRLIEQNFNSSHYPIDGKVYKIGDSIGNPSASVISILNSSLATIYIDYLPELCGKSIQYRVFAFRYSKDDLNQDSLPTNARGRSYNETEYAEIRIMKLIPPKPKITIKENNTIFCRGDSALLYFNDEAKDYEYQWLNNGREIENKSKEIIIKESGSYQLLIRNKEGCINISDPIIINVLDAPKASIYYNYTPIFKDTTIVICTSDEIELLASGGNEIKWYRDDSLYSNNNTIKVVSEGKYYAIVGNQTICEDTTHIVKVKFIKIDYTKSADTLYFRLNDIEDYQKHSIIITNNSQDTLKLSNFNIPSSFEVIEPNLPIIIPPNTFIKVIINYTPQGAGANFQKIIFETYCSNKDTIYLDCLKEAMGIKANTYSIIFPNLISCNTESYDTSIIISNPSSEEITIFQPQLDSPFTLTQLNYPIILKTNEKIELKLKINTDKEGNYESFLLIPYKTITKQDTLIINIKCNIYTPNFLITYDTLILPPLKSCEEFYDTTIQIFNHTNVDLAFLINKEEGIELSEYSFILEKHKEKSINVRFNPKKEGNYLFNIRILAEPCNIKKSLTVIGSKEGVVFSFNRDTIDFGMLIQCKDSSDKVEKLIIYANGKGAYNSSIKEVKIYGNYLHNIQLNNPIQDSIEYEITFPPCPDGEYFGELKLILTPCDYEKSIYLKGKRISPKYEISSYEIDFGVIEKGLLTQKSLEVKNTGSLELKIVGFDNLGPPFNFSTNNTKLPFILKPDSSISYYFDYIQEDISNDSLFIEMKIDTPCELKNIIKLKGKTYSSDSKFTLLQSFEGESKIKVADVIDLNIILSDYQNSYLKDLYVDSILICLIFNPALLDILKIDKGQSIAQLNQCELAYNIDNKSGKVFIKLSNFNKRNFINPLKLINITLRGLLGNSHITKLKIDSMYIFSNRKVEVITTEKEITIEGNCDLENRFVNVGKSADLNIINSTIEYQVISEDRTTIKIYDLLGNEVFSLVDGYLKPNRYKINIDIEKLSGSVYFLIFKNGNIIKRKIVYF